MKKGLLVVIDGIDGSGKTVQVELLKQALDTSWEAISFPRYEDNIYGKLVRRYLEGEFGDLTKVNPYLMALVYAGDRMLAKPVIEKWLTERKLVIANRYVSSSYAHLGANLPVGGREKFISWLDELEYGTNKIPKEDLTILLDVDPNVGQKNVSNRYPDLHEDNLKHLEKANKIYLELAKKEPNWYVVDCMKGNQMRLPEDIHKQIMTAVKKCLK